MLLSRAAAPFGVMNRGLLSWSAVVTLGSLLTLWSGGFSVRYFWQGFSVKIFWPKIHIENIWLKIPSKLFEIVEFSFDIRILTKNHNQKYCDGDFKSKNNLFLTFFVVADVRRRRQQGLWWWHTRRRRKCRGLKHTCPRVCTPTHDVWSYSTYGRRQRNLFKNLHSRHVNRPKRCAWPRWSRNRCQKVSGAKYFRRKSGSKTVAGRACGARAARAYGPSADRAKVPPSRTLQLLAFDE